MILNRQASLKQNTRLCDSTLKQKHLANSQKQKKYSNFVCTFYKRYEF